MENKLRADSKEGLGKGDCQQTRSLVFFNVNPKSQTLIGVSLELWQSLNHPNIAKLYTYELSSTKVIFTEQKAGINLRQLILHYKNKSEPTPAIIVKMVSFQICRALALMRLKNLVHGGLSTQCITIDLSSQRLVVGGLERVANVECCQQLSEEPKEEAVWYAAPELYLEGGKHSLETDMWAFGCIVAEMIVQQPYFRDPKDRHPLLKIAEMLGQSNKIPSDISKLICKYQIASKQIPAESDVIFESLTKIAEPGLIALIGRLLHWDPLKRITATDAMTHDYFSQIYSKSLKINGKDIAPLTDFSPLETACYSKQIKALLLKNSKK